MREGIDLVLKKHGYITDFEETGEGVNKQFKITIAYAGDNEPRVHEAKRVSKLSRRIYSGYRNLKPVKYGHGMMVMSTPQGLMTESEARKAKIGGEALFIIW